MKEYIKSCRQEYLNKVKEYINNNINAYFISNEERNDINSLLYCTSCFTDSVMFSKIMKCNDNEFILRSVTWQYIHDRDITNSSHNRFVGSDDTYYQFRVKTWTGYTMESAIESKILYDISKSIPGYIKNLLDSDVEMEGAYRIHLTDDEEENDKRCIETVNNVIKKYSKHEKNKNT